MGLADWMGLLVPPVQAPEEPAAAAEAARRRMLAALERERETYVTRGLEDRVAQVDEQLAHYRRRPDRNRGSK